MSVISAMLHRDFVTAYGRGAEGFLWAILEPIVGITLLTLIFSQMSQTPPVGSCYPLFYATGYLVYLQFVSVVGRVSAADRMTRSVRSHGGISVYHAFLSRFLLQNVISSLIWVLVLCGIWVIYAPAETIDVWGVCGAFVTTSVCGGSVGVLNASMTSAFQPWEKVWGLISRPLFLVSGVFYPFYLMPKSLQEWLWWNPVVHVIGSLRDAVYLSYNGDYVSCIYVWCFSFVALIMGVLVLREDS